MKMKKKNRNKEKLKVNNLNRGGIYVNCPSKREREKKRERGH